MAALPRPDGKVVRAIRRKLWDQDRFCYWCRKETILPEDLLRRFIPLDDIYANHMAHQLNDLINQLSAKSTEFRTAWRNDLATVDHLLEHAAGGTYDEENLVIACYPCNHERGLRFNRTLLDEGDG